MFKPKRIYNDNKYALFIRHSERENAHKENVGVESMLTPRGIELSKEFGLLLKNQKINAIYSSPILRCVQTANAINETLSGNTIDIILTNKLGLPSMAINDTNESGKLYSQFTGKEIYNKYINGFKSKALTPAHILKEKTMQFLNKICTNEGITLLISHDASIAHIKYALGCGIYLENQWVDFLDGFILKV